MANALAVTERAVSKEISRWQQDNVIKRVGGRYIVCDMPQLKKEAGGFDLSIHHTTEQPAN